MRWTSAIETVLAFAKLSALLPYIIALAIFFLALGFFAVAVLSVWSIDWVKRKLILAFSSVSCLLKDVLIVSAIRAVVATAKFGTCLSRRKALTVHFQTASFFTIAPASIFLRCGYFNTSGYIIQYHSIRFFTIVTSVFGLVCFFDDIWIDLGFMVVIFTFINLILQFCVLNLMIKMWVQLSKTGYLFDWVNKF